MSFLRPSACIPAYRSAAHCGRVLLLWLPRTPTIFPVTYVRFICVLLVGVAGCASRAAELRQDNHRLAQSVSELRAERRSQERKIADLEHQLALLKNTASPVDIPPLPVEVVTPPQNSEQRVVGIADDGSEIVYEGDAARGTPAVLDSVAQRRLAMAAVTGGRSEVGRRTSSAFPAARSQRSHPRQERDARPANDAAAGEYRAAVELVKAGKHDDAVVALRAFLRANPGHDFADNAQYWLGESFYGRKDYPHALAEFRTTIETYPRGNKVPDALLKVGYCYGAMGQADKARAVLEQVVNLYPNSEPAALASKRLETP